VTPSPGELRRHFLERDFEGTILQDCRVNRDTYFRWEDRMINGLAERLCILCVRYGRMLGSPTYDESHLPRIPAVRCTAMLCRCISWQLPAGEDKHSRMALQSTSEDLRPLDAKAHTIVLDCGDAGLRDTRQVSQLILAQFLELTNDAYRLACGRSGSWESQPTAEVNITPPISDAGFVPG